MSKYGRAPQEGLNTTKNKQQPIQNIVKQASNKSIRVDNSKTVLEDNQDGHEQSQADMPKYLFQLTGQPKSSFQKDRPTSLVPAVSNQIEINI